MGKKSSSKLKQQPLLVRDGARYTCRADGICCTSIHGLGPLTDIELVQIKKVDERGAAYDDDFEDNMLRVAPDGGCHFMMPNKLCSVHAELGEEAKPEGCRKFPYGVTRTPLGDRITTEHRCTCRTMGTRPLVTAEAARPSLLDHKERVDVDRTVGKRLRLERKGGFVPFEVWLDKEASLLGRLAAGDSIIDVLGAEPFPELSKSTWVEQAEEFSDGVDGARFGFLLAWAGETIAHMHDNRAIRMPPRPWKADFERVESTTTERNVDEMFADWVADEIWALKWAEDHSWEVAAADIRTRYEIARALMKQNADDYQREDTRAAEAIMVAAVISDSEYWETILNEMRP